METKVGPRRKRGAIIRRFRTVDYAQTPEEVLASLARKSVWGNRTPSECTRERLPTVDPAPPVSSIYIGCLVQTEFYVCRTNSEYVFRFLGHGCLLLLEGGSKV